MENTKQFIKTQVREIKDAVGSEKVICALSGGVDSSTCALLAHNAVGDKLDCVFLDDGLMREGEGEYIKGVFARLGVKVRIVSIAGEFFKALAGITDPEEKRKAFRDTFYRVLGRTVRDSGARYMIQGTIAADIKETAGGIKTQHNVLEQIGINPKEYGLTILEPLKTLYKPEVREVAKALGLPAEIYRRMPFPGPALATRVIGEVTPERVEVCRRAHVIVEEETRKYKPFQAFAVLLSDRATGVVNGKREFGRIIVVRSVDSKDALTAEVTDIPLAHLKRMQKRICAEIPGVTKVLYDLTPKPPSTIEYI
jgi:GMP synthase (glutamine-hydrolysing)